MGQEEPLPLEKQRRKQVDTESADDAMDAENVFLCARSPV